MRQSNEGVNNWLKTMDNLTVFEGHGRLESAYSVRIDGEHLEADKIILNVGGRANVPDLPGLDQIDPLTTRASWMWIFSPNT